jgi:hypothetical protein
MGDSIASASQNEMNTLRPVYAIAHVCGPNRTGSARTLTDIVWFNCLPRSPDVGGEVNREQRAPRRSLALEVQLPPSSLELSRVC